MFIIMLNYFTARRIFNVPTEKIESAKLSILIPARNEESNIANIIKSIEKQDFNYYELLILDDNSEDNTYSIIEEHSKKNEKIKVTKGKELPKSWLGKNWACYQLSKLAVGDYLLFVDADVRLKKYAISYSLWLMKKFNLRMLTVFPTQITKTIGEKLIVPLMNWLLISFLPLDLVYRSARESFVAANGQFLLIEKNTYMEIGTHEKFKDKVVEDMEIARAVKRSKNKLMTCVGNNTILTEMYNSFSEALKGFSKNFFAGFNTSRTLFLIFVSLLFTIFILPFVLLFFNPLFVFLAVLIFIQRIFISLISNEKIIFNILLHPLQMIIMFFTGLNSIYKKKKIWKGRYI
jgi:glycosyltransferase involved in cell wall biosynthesis